MIQGMRGRTSARAGGALTALLAVLALCAAAAWGEAAGGGSRSPGDQRLLGGSAAVTPTLWKVPPNRSADRTPTFGFGSAEPGVSFECRLDARPPVPCDPPRTYRVRPGRHVFEVVALGARGGRGAGPARDVFTVLRRPERKLAPRAPHFGYNENWLVHEAFVERAAASGADSARFNVSWLRVEPQPGVFRWDAYDALYERMIAMGVRPVMVLLDAPCWAHAEDPGECAGRALPATPPHPRALEAFSRFAGLVAARYPLARGIEVWNEPNFGDYWRTGLGGAPGAPDPARYARLLAAAHEGIERANPKMPVIAAGLLADGVGGGRGMPYARFLEQMLRAGSSFDAVAIHPYTFFAARPASKVRAVLATVRRLLEKLGEPGTPIWVTEVGISTSGPRPATPAGQARALAAIHGTIARASDIPVAIFHRLLDDPSDPDSREAGWGVLSSTGEPKPAYCALARVRQRELC